MAATAFNRLYAPTCVHASRPTALPCHAVFLMPEACKPADLIGQLGCDLTSKGTVPTKDYEKTNVPGLYAKLIDVDKVDLVVSPYATNQITPAMPIVMQKNMVYMGLFGTDVNANFKYDRYFATIPNGPDGKRAPTLGFLEIAAGMNPHLLRRHAGFLYLSPLRLF